jgi:hypothetical protein
MSRTWHRAFDQIESGNVPVIAVLHGAVIGGASNSRLRRIAASPSTSGAPSTLPLREGPAIVPDVHDGALGRALGYRRYCMRFLVLEE